jgi:DNA-binding response OmpR family regulator
MSASQSRIHAVKKSNAGTCFYIVKPFGIAEFKQVLHSCFGPAQELVAS